LDLTPSLDTDAGQRDIFCGYATQFASTTTVAKPTAASSTGTPAQSTQDTNQNAATTGTGTGTATATGSNPTNTNSGAFLALNAGGVMAAVAGVVAVVL
jgi:hypothetical protein